MEWGEGVCPREGAPHGKHRSKGLLLRAERWAHTRECARTAGRVRGGGVWDESSAGEMAAHIAGGLAQRLCVLAKVGPRRCEQPSLGDNGIGAAGAVALADALVANSMLKRLESSDNSIGNVGVPALARALPTNCSLTEVCASPYAAPRLCRVPRMGAALPTYTHTPPPCHSSMVVTQLYLGVNIGDAGTSAVVGVLAANDM